MTEKESNYEESHNTKYKDGVNRNARLIVRNVSFKATEEKLRKHFEPYGSVEEVTLLKKPDGKLVGCGFVHFTHVPMANEALTATNKKQFLGRPLFVSWAVPKHKYDENTHEKPPKKRKISDNVEEQVIKSEDETDEVPKKVVKLEKDDKTKVNSEKVKVNRNARLVVRNVSFKATEDSLKEHFAPYGEILEVKLLKKPNGKLVGCAFVHYKNVPMAKKALLNTNMKPFLGRPISVDWAVAKDKYMKFMDEQNLKMQEVVKKEESDSDTDNEDAPINISGDDLKKEVKSESEEEDEKSEDSNSDQSDQDDDDDDDDEDEDEDDDEDDEQDEEMSDDMNMSNGNERKRIKLNDAEDGCTVFVTNIPFSVDNYQLQQFAEKSGPVKYALVCVDKLTEHSRGTGFVKFVNKEDTDKFLSLSPQELKIDGQVLQVKPALKKESLQTGKKKEPKDNRNLYLVKEGVIVAGTKAAVGVSASDMAKRLALERSKTQMLKNLNRFVSRYRLVVSNLPPHVDDARLRALTRRSAPPRAALGEARVMRHLRQTAPDGKHPSKGYGFVMFQRHEDALACLRKLNNNPDIFDKNNRPIVSFSIEDRTALNARKKRLEKSIANNPLANKGGGNINRKNRRSFKDRNKPDESKSKGKNQNGAEYGQFVRIRKQDDMSEFTGLTAKEGAQHKIRNMQKLRAQADLHRQNVKLEKKTSKRSLKLKMAAKERIKQPKQKINKNNIKSKNKLYLDGNRFKATFKDDASSLNEVVGKYKTKSVGNSTNEVKVKWYEK